ncbi:S8 family peptidase [Clostridium cellulovorans]|uniref:Peptidase S8 and S53 subtilisin kexin sedolisin n=1 Tax=Clostridium cellulovorans (strain ATCC 35296 / DSM 3052 / OCM 3 / 743B) TaxID=573061 RepID=D9SMB7_CLOC7|nr:S8 family serine peptidase [Clostridium cellulovorans]ADL53773.1 peptidase S8 and S53 subtilisin kexin sedolisin [Clostridium cellulovorans 743B]
MKKRLFGTLIFALFFINAVNLIDTTVLADSSVKQKIDIEGFKTDERNIVKNEIIVKYKSKENNSNVLSYFLGSKKSESKIEKIKVDNREQLMQRIEELKNDSNVEFVQPNYKYEKFDMIDTQSNNAMTTNSGLSGKQWYLENYQIPQVWDKSTGKGVTVAILDTGIDSSHEDLIGKVKGGKDFTGTGSYLDNNGHGTAIAGIIAADKANNIGITGVAYDSKLLSVKVLDENGFGDTATIAQGIRWSADNGAKVLNISLGSLEDDPILEESVNYAASKGCILVAATGNYGFQKVTYPAAYDNVIAVGSVNETNQWCYFSSYGKELDIVAPGTKIYSTVPAAKFPSKYEAVLGTSASSAIVSGQVALMVSQKSQLTVQDVLDKIKNSCFSLSDSLSNMFYGYGLLDIKKIVTGVSGQLPTTVIGNNDNTINEAEKITGPKALVNKLSCNSDANWYKVSIPANSVAKFTFNTLDNGILANVFSDKFSSTDNIFVVIDQSEYYISNYNKDKTKNFYLEVYNPFVEKSNCTINIQYLSIKDTSIPKDSTLKYSIDSPKQGQVIAGNTLDLSGWAISKLGLANAKAIIDDQIMDIRVGVKRPDVLKAFSDYGDENSGFSGSLNLSKFSYGSHKLKLVFTDNRGVTQFTSPITFTIKDTLKYSIDTVKSGTNITGKYLSLSGWALSKASIEKIETLIDNNKVAELKYGIARNDVYNVFKEYNNKDSGFIGNIDITKYNYGSHILQLRVIYKGGRTQVTEPVSFNISSTLKSCLDSLKQGDIITGSSLDVSGWVLSKVGIKKVQVIIDDKEAVDVSYGKSRTDVYNAFKDYENKNSGFTGNVDIKNLSYGEHNLKILVTEAGGKTSTLSNTKFIVKNSLYCVDSPTSGKDVTGNILNISGWAISKAGIGKVEVIIDETIAQKLQYGLSRPDVYAAFKGYNNQNSGYLGSIDISKLSYGIHNLQIKVSDKVGRTTISEIIKINIIEERKYAVDSPQKGMSLSGGNLEVAGWVLSKTGITKVEAVIDGVAKDIQNKLSRPDVYGAFKSFGNQNSGYKGKIDISKLPCGDHSLTIRFTDARGLVTMSEAVNFNIQNTLKYSIDFPCQGLIIPTNKLEIGGWALSKTKITKVEAVVDGITQSLIYGLSRPDVYKIFSEYNNENSGFCSSIDISKFHYGNHYLVIKFTDESGRVSNSNTVVFNIPNTVKFNIDTPKNNIKVTDSTLKVNGWVLSRNSIKKIEVLIDDKLVQNVKYGVSRPDVYKAFSYYDNKNAGFTASIDISKFNKGVHSLVIRFTDGGGRTNFSDKLTFSY